MKKISILLLSFLFLITGCSKTTHNQVPYPDGFAYQYDGQQYYVEYKRPADWSTSSSVSPMVYSAPPNYTITIYGDPLVTQKMLTLASNGEANTVASIIDNSTDVSNAEFEWTMHEEKIFPEIRYENKNGHVYVYGQITTAGLIFAKIECKDQNPYEKEMKDIITTINVREL